MVVVVVVVAVWLALAATFSLRLPDNGWSRVVIKGRTSRQHNGEQALGSPSILFCTMLRPLHCARAGKSIFTTAEAREHNLAGYYLALQNILLGECKRDCSYRLRPRSLSCLRENLALAAKLKLH